MKLHEIERVDGATHRRKRLGLGQRSGKGKTCGKGHKGQMARKGHKRKRGFEGGQMRLIRRLPKRGFKNFNRKDFAPVNVGDLSRFDQETVVTVDALRKAGLVKGPCDGIKILGYGDISLKLTVHADAFSETAKAKIEAAGGSCEVVTR